MLNVNVVDTYAELFHKINPILPQDTSSLVEQREREGDWVVVPCN